jgi:hypothetical protein
MRKAEGHIRQRIVKVVQNVISDVTRCDLRTSLQSIVDANTLREMNAIYTSSRRGETDKQQIRQCSQTSTIPIGERKPEYTESLPVRCPRIHFFIATQAPTINLTGNMHEKLCYMTAVVTILYLVRSIFPDAYHARTIETPRYRRVGI